MAEDVPAQLEPAGQPDRGSGPARGLDIGALRSEITRRRARLLAIDGPGGAGKSTLARQLADAWPNAVIVETDDFYRPSAERLMRPEVHGANYDLDRLSAEVLEPLAAGRAGLYRRYDWSEDRLAEYHEVPPGAIVLVEGVYSSSEAIRRHFDYTVWVDCRPEIRLRRGIERDGEQMRTVWLAEWMPAEKLYLEAERPEVRANLVLDGSGGADGVVFRVLCRRT